MNERLTLQDLIDSLSQKQGMTKKDAETFLRELIAVISENIEALDPVKIKDFGTFKPVKVNARKSVDVNTGETIEIPAHYKLSFTPDKSLKEAVNHPFSHFESVVIEEGVSFDNIESSEIPEDAEEEVDDEETLEVAPALVSFEMEVKEEVTEETLLTEPEVIEENSVKEDEVDIEESSNDINEEEVSEIAANSEKEEVISTSSEETIEEDAVEEESVEEITTISETKKESTPEVEKQPEEEEETESQQMFEHHKRKTLRRRFISMGFIVFLILGAFALGGLYFQEIMKSFSGQLNKKEIVEKSEKRTNKIISPVKNKDVDSLSVVADETNVITENKQDTIKVATIPVIIKDTIKSGKTLRLISLKHYGHRSFWPYIYEENKEVIKNPNNVPIGTELIIPPAEKYGIDAKNRESIEKAKSLESKLIRELGL